MYPHGPDDITIEGLAAALAMDPGLIASIDTEVIGQGVGILCQLARVTISYRGDALGPKSVIAKYPAAMEQTRGLARQFRFYEREVAFYKRLAKDISLPTAHCHHGAHDAASDDFLLLLEDLGDRRIGDQLNGCSAEDAFVAVRQIATLHGEWWDSPGLEALDWMPAGDSELNKGGMALYPFAWPLYLQRYGDGLPDDMRRIGERLCGQIAGMLERTRDRPHTICHGDFRLDNLFFGARSDQPPIAAVDWQIALRSVGTYDIGYFISKSVPPALRREIELDLLRSYHDRLIELGVRNYSFADCIDDYRWTLLFCFCYPVIGGGFGDVANERGVALAKAMTDRCVSAIRDWKAHEFLKA